MDESTKLFLLPVIAGLIGWATNWVAVKMLFHPKQPVDLIFFKLQGIFHQRQKEIAFKLGDLIEDKLFSHGDIHDKITSPEFIRTLLPIVERRLDSFLAEKLISIHPMLAMLPDSMLDSIRGVLMEEFETFLPDLIDSASDKLGEAIQIRDVVREKIEKFDVAELEDILFSILKSEFKMIEYVGGVLGFFIGLAQVGVIRFM